MKTKTKPAKKAATKSAATKPAKKSKSADTGTPKSDLPSSNSDLPSPIQIRKEDKELPLAAIVPSPDNRTVSPDELETDFLDSIRKWGVLERLWVYPLAADDKRRKKDATHELIAGERRWCGAGVVGLKTIPVTIFHCSDMQADELRIIENLHRRNLTEIEEGRSYARLRDKHGYVVCDEKHPERSLVHVLTKSESYIFGRIKLVEAPKIVVEALTAAKVTPSVALRVARISDPKAQVAAMAEIVQAGNGYGNKGRTLMTDAAAAKLIEEKYQRQLKGAPFDIKDAALVPVEFDDQKHRTGGGACDDCPLRSGNQKEMQLEKGAKPRGDMCLNPSCYTRKTEAAWKKQCAEAKAQGAVIIPADEAQNIFYGWGEKDALNSNCRYVFPSDTCPDDPKRRSFKALLGDPHPLDVARYLARAPRSGKAYTLFLRAECKSSIIAAGVHDFYEAKQDERKEDTAEHIIALRETALQEEETEWRLSYLIDQIATHPGGFHHEVYPSMVSALCVHEYDAGEVVSDALRRWTPVKEFRPTSIAPAFVGTLDSQGAQAFLLEACLRRLIGYGGIEALNEAIDEIATECGIEVEREWNTHTGLLAARRKVGESQTVRVEHAVLKMIGAARGPERPQQKRPVLSFQFHGRHYVNFSAEAGGCDDCWEMVPVKAYDGKTHIYGKDDYGNEGLLVQQKGIEYALRGPRLAFYQRAGQCAKCACVADFTDESKVTWATEEQILCTKCDGQVGKAVSK